MTAVKSFTVRVKKIPGASAEVNLSEANGCNTLKKAIEGSGFNAEGSDAQIGAGDPIPSDKWGKTILTGDETIYLIESINGGRA